MESPDNNAWTGTNIFAHLNDFEDSNAENILENNHSQMVEVSDDDREKSTEDTGDATGNTDNSSEDAVNITEKVANATGNSKIGIKIPKFEATNRNYVLQCQEDMTQDFIDYLKEMSTSYVDSADTGKWNTIFSTSFLLSIYETFIFFVEMPDFVSHVFESFF